MATKQQIKKELEAVVKELESVEEDSVVVAEPVVAEPVVAEPVVAEPVVAEETKKAEEVVVEETFGSFASVLDLTVKVSPTVQMAIDQAADRLIRDKENFPNLKGG